MKIEGTAPSQFLS